MAFKKVEVTATDLYTLERKSLSKLIHTLPAVSDAKSVEEVAPKTAYWPLYTCVQAQLAKIEDAGDQILNLFTREYSNAELRKGFVHTETGRAIAELWTTTPKPGDVLNYKVQEWQRIFEEIIDRDPVKLRVGVNTKLFQYVEGFTDADHYAQVMDQITSAGANALKDAMKTFIYSLLLGENHKMFIKNFYMDRLWAKDIQLTDETESKAYKEFYKSDGEFRKLCKEAAGEFQAKFKNKRYFNPMMDTTWDWKRDGEYKAEAIAAATSEGDVKTRMLARYCLGSDNANNKSKPVKWLTRDQCIWSMVEQIRQAVEDLTRIPAVENWMEYDPHATTQPTNKQLPCRCTKDNLVIFMNPHDLSACMAGAGYTGPGGTSYGLRSISSIGVTAIPVDGMLPGDCYIIDKRTINIIPIYNAMFSNFNGYDLVDQRFMHLQFKWGVFRYFAGMQIIATKWVPHASWMAEFNPIFTA